MQTTVIAPYHRLKKNSKFNHGNGEILVYKHPQMCLYSGKRGTFNVTLLCYSVKSGVWSPSKRMCVPETRKQVIAVYTYQITNFIKALYFQIPGNFYEFKNEFKRKVL
jgi:hypothetical protein